MAEEAVEVVNVTTQTFDDVFTEDESKQVINDRNNGCHEWAVEAYPRP